MLGHLSRLVQLRLLTCPLLHCPGVFLTCFLLGIDYWLTRLCNPVMLLGLERMGPPHIRIICWMLVAPVLCGRFLQLLLSPVLLLMMWFLSRSHHTPSSSGDFPGWSPRHFSSHRRSPASAFGYFLPARVCSCLHLGFASSCRHFRKDR